MNHGSFDYEFSENLITFIALGKETHTTNFC